MQIHTRVTLLVAYLLLTLGQTQLFIDKKITNVFSVLLLLLIFIWFALSCTKIAGVQARIILIGLISLPLVLPALSSAYLADGSRIAWFLLMVTFPLHVSAHGESYSQLLRPLFSFYMAIGLLIIGDAAMYFLIGAPFFFEVMIYLTPRFTGPFFDPNFLGLIYAILFISTFHQGWRYDRTKLLRLVCAICILLAGSLSVIGFLVGAFAIGALVKLRSAAIVPFVLVVVSLVIYPLFAHYADSLNTALSVYLYEYFNIPPSIFQLKFLSFVQRAEAVSDGANLFFQNPFGYGYQSLLQHLPRDPHNSYVGMAFEYGIFPLVCILLSFSLPLKNFAARALVYFISSMALMLNVHYSPIYLASIMILICWASTSRIHHRKAFTLKF